MGFGNREPGCVCLTVFGLKKLIDHERWWHFLLKDKQQYTKNKFVWLTILDSSRIAILPSNIFPISDNLEVQNCTSGKGERGWNFLQLSSFRMNEGSEKRRCWTVVPRWGWKRCLRAFPTSRNDDQVTWSELLASRGRITLGIPIKVGDVSTQDDGIPWFHGTWEMLVQTRRFFFALGVKPPRYLAKFTPSTLDLFLGWVSHTNKRLLTLIETSVTFAL